jgi:hypothetical protein
MYNLPWVEEVHHGFSIKNILIPEPGRHKDQTRAVMQVMMTGTAEPLRHSNLTMSLDLQDEV